MVSTGIDNTTNILGVYDSLDRAIGRNSRAYWNIINNEKTFDKDFNTTTGSGHILFEYNGSVSFKIQEIDLNKDITLN
jgi:hypothetical protein